MRKWVSLLITGAILWTFTCSCSKQPKYHAGGPHYYKSWANYYQPYRPIDEIQIDEAKELEGKGYAYYIAFFDENGFIRSFEKRYKGKMIFKVVYFYEKGKIEKEEVTDEGGGIKTFLYDKDGEKIKP